MPNLILNSDRKKKESLNEFSYINIIIYSLNSCLVIVNFMRSLIEIYVTLGVTD